MKDEIEGRAKGGYARAAKLSAEQKSEIAKKAVPSPGSAAEAANTTTPAKSIARMNMAAA